MFKNNYDLCGLIYACDEFQPDKTDMLIDMITNIDIVVYIDIILISIIGVFYV